MPYLATHCSTLVCIPPPRFRVPPSFSPLCRPRLTRGPPFCATPCVYYLQYNLSSLHDLVCLVVAWALLLGGGRRSTPRFLSSNTAHTRATTATLPYCCSNFCHPPPADFHHHQPAPHSDPIRLSHLCARLPSPTFNSHRPSGQRHLSHRIKHPGSCMQRACLSRLAHL